MRFFSGYQRLAATLATVAAMTLFSGCAKAPGKGAQAETKDGKIKIAAIVFQEDQFFRLIEKGMQEAADKAGAELLLANSENKPDKEIQIINTYIARKVQAIVISPQSAKSSISALRRAHEKGIKIVTYNSTVSDAIPVSFVESDQRALGSSTGQVARQYIEKKLGGKARIAILAFKSLVPEQSDARTGGFKKALEGMPGVQVVAEQDAWLAEAAVKRAGDILTAHPDLDLIWSANEGGTVGAAMAIKNAGRAGKVVVFGTDTSDQLAAFLLASDNVLQAITGQRPMEIGQKSIEMAIKAVKDEAVEKKVTMTGMLLTREKPDEVKAFQAQLKELTR